MKKKRSEGPLETLATRKNKLFRISTNSLVSKLESNTPILRNLSTKAKKKYCRPTKPHLISSNLKPPKGNQPLKLTAQCWDTKISSRSTLSWSSCLSWIRREANYWISHSTDGMTLIEIWSKTRANSRWKRSFWNTWTDTTEKIFSRPRSMASRQLSTPTKRHIFVRKKRPVKESGPLRLIESMNTSKTS